ncbi:MAG: CGEA protein [Sporolactobacillus sp.]
MSKHKHDHGNNATDLDFLFRSLLPGTVITVIGASGNIYGPAVFTSYNRRTGLVALTETTSISPITTTTIYIPVSNIESVSFSS